ncbi:transcription factor 23 [Dasypus novemcinctus]|uniref:transcription factor 23 n=1 Tax=Dasypus novemcinctus TaxID=9361 RepID=UPI00265F50A6|nr:transcription factor 23 [Dasypus novemcinctus]
MSQREARAAPAVQGVGHSRARARPQSLPGTDRKRSRLSRTGQGLWDEPGWSSQRWSRAAPSLRGPRARSLAHGRGPVGPENAARERSRVRTLRQAFLALQATLPAVPPDTKLSKLDVLVLAASYIAHLTRTLGHELLGHELPGPARPPFPRGLRYLHPLKKWPMRSRLYAGGLACPDLDSTLAPALGQRRREAGIGPQASGEAAAGLPTRPLSPALGDK